MTMTRSALLLGGTGAMGSHLTSLLEKEGWDVVVTTRVAGHCPEGASCVVGSAKNRSFLASVLVSRHWDTVIDFMIWSTLEFREVRDLLLGSCDQYVFLSSYRVFAASTVVNERSPRLLDACKDEEYLATDEYALAKARQEDLLRASDWGGWTIVRPTVTYSRGRHQLGVLECNEWLPRVLSDHAVPVPGQMLAAQATMTWGGDAARMISLLCGNPVALGEDFNICTSRHCSWGEIAKAYQVYVPLRVCECSVPEYERRLGRRYQIRYDRLIDRVMDNSKALTACGLAEGDLLPLEEGIEREFVPYLRTLPSVWTGSSRLQGRLDRISGELWSPKALPVGEGVAAYSKYIYGRFIN